MLFFGLTPLARRLAQAHGEEKSSVKVSDPRKASGPSCVADIV